MIVALSIDLTPEWSARASGLLAQDAMVVPAEAGAAAEVAHRLPVALVVINTEPLTARKVLDYQQVCDIAGGQPVTVAIGGTDVRAQMRTDGLFVPEYWLAPGAGAGEVAETLQLALSRVTLTRRGMEAMAAPAPLAAAAPATFGHHDSILRNLLSAMAGDHDIDRLLRAYVDAAAQMSRAAGYCLLWQGGEGEALHIKLSQGLPPELAQHGRLAPSDALPTWYRQNCRALTRQELARWPEAAMAAALHQELGVFRGEVVIPLLPGGRLQGLLILGAKVTGQEYSAPELEGLFALTGYITLRLENLQLQEQVRHTQTYMERSLAGMRCGLITLGPDDRLIVCNPYAAHLLGRPVRELEGADLRVLPSPLGDYLYAARESREAAVSGERVQLPQREQSLRVTTSTLVDDTGRAIGAVLLLEDSTGAVEDAAAAARQETIHALTRIIGRVAHEVRTPLTAIKTYAELMSEPDDLQELARFWRDTVNPELERLDRLITEQVRLVEQPEPSPQLIRLEEVVEQAVTQAAQEHQKAPPALKVVRPLPLVVADPAPTRDALTYLLSYLYDHGASGVGVVVDESRRGPVPRVRVRMRVNVNGERMDPQEILDPLTVLQLEQGDLGPAIGKQLVDKQGGSVEGAQGDGYMEFRVSFPVTVVDPPQLPTGDQDV